MFWSTASGVRRPPAIQGLLPTIFAPTSRYPARLMAKPKDKTTKPKPEKAKPEKGKPTSSYLRRYGIDTVWAHLALNVASVLMLTLAFPKPGWAVMAFFAPVPIGVLAMRSTRLWTLGWTTLLVFSGWWALRVLWLNAVSPAAPWGVGLVMGLWMAVMVVALARVQRRFRPAMTLMLPVFWVAQEAVRSVWPWGGFPWFTLGSSQAMWKPTQGVPFPSGYLVQSADLFGVLTVSFLVAMTAGLVVDLIARPMTKRTHTGKVRPRRTVVVACGLWLVGFGGALVYGIMTVAAADSPSIGRKDHVTITVIQTNVPQSNKNSGTPEQRQEPNVSQVGREHLARTEPQAPQGRDGRTASTEPRAHHLGHADAAEHQGHERHQPQVRTDVVERTGEPRARPVKGLEAQVGRAVPKPGLHRPHQLCRRRPRRSAMQKGYSSPKSRLRSPGGTQANMSRTCPRRQYDEWAWATN